jgi:hypothetical protein
MAEHFANEFATTLVGTITGAATSLVAATSSGAPAVNFRVRIDDEYLLVTAGPPGSTTWTVTRAQEGSVAATHQNGAAVQHVLTAGGLNQALAEVIQAAQSSPLFVGTRTAATYADVDSTNGKVTLQTNGGNLLAILTGYASNTLASVAQHVGLRLDAGADVGAVAVYSYASNAGFPVPFCVGYLFTAVAAGSHTVYARHVNDSAAGTMTTAGTLQVVEIS